MDVERTMQFILESQARSEARMEQWQVRMDRADARMDRADARMDRAEARAAAVEKRVEKQLEAIRTIMKQGMRWMAKTEREMSLVRQELKELAAAQKETERSLNRFIDSMQNGRRNGH